ncbi:MAG: BCAM0308 family protein [candidate division WOR-3 bacterium]|nr:BCAM0308 family protein [candidate division WOR-3 bacterium]
MPVKRSSERSSPRPKLADPYLLSKAYSEPTICPTCGLVYHKKRWLRDEHIRTEIEKIAEKHKCPACRKIEDHYVMGLVTITGTFVLPNKNEIVNIIRNQEKKESLRNPLARIMSLNNKENLITVETTVENLAITIGKALENAYHGELKISFSDNEKLVRVYWHRDLESKKKTTK